MWSPESATGIVAHLRVNSVSQAAAHLAAIMRRLALWDD
jgi:hypothetical protein